MEVSLAIALSTGIIQNIEFEAVSFYLCLKNDNIVWCLFAEHSMCVEFVTRVGWFSEVIWFIVLIFDLKKDKYWEFYKPRVDTRRVKCFFFLPQLVLTLDLYSDSSAVLDDCFRRNVSQGRITVTVGNGIVFLNDYNRKIHYSDDG